MSLIISDLLHGHMGNFHSVAGAIAFDASYPTGGELLAPGDIGLGHIAFMWVPPKSGFVFEYDYTNQKLMAFTQGVAHGAAGSVTLDDYPVTAGPGATASSSISREASATSPLLLGPMKQIASTDDLSTVTGVRFFAVGY